MSKSFPNFAGVANIDDACAAELEAAGINVERYEFLRGKGEVSTAVVGSLHGWGFKRAWRYWVAEGPGIEMAVAEALHARHGRAVRVEGHCGCPSPREWKRGFAISSYHVDTPEGLRALAETIKGVVEHATAVVDEKPRTSDATVLTEDQTNRAYRLFYGEGMNLGQVAETLGCGLYALTPWLTAPSHRIAEQAITDSKTEKADAYAKLDDDSLNAIMEVIGSPKLYSSGRSAMRAWFLRRLRWLWQLPEPPTEEAPKRTRREAKAHVEASNAQWLETKAVCDSQPVQATFASPAFEDLDDDGQVWLAAIVEVAQRRERERLADLQPVVARVAGMAHAQLTQLGYPERLVTGMLALGLLPAADVVALAELANPQEGA